MFLTIIGGAIFVGSQAWEWKNFIAGTYGAVKTQGGNIIQFTDAEGHRVALKDFVVASRELTEDQSKMLGFSADDAFPTYTMEDVKTSFASNTNLRVRIQQLNEKGEKTVLDRLASIAMLNRGIKTVEGANLEENEYGHPLFADIEACRQLCCQYSCASLEATNAGNQVRCQLSSTTVGGPGGGSWGTDTATTYQETSSCEVVT